MVEPTTAGPPPAAKYISFLDDSITLLIPGAPPIRGVAAYRSALEPLFQAASHRIFLGSPRLLEVAGPWAFAHYVASITTLPKNGTDSSMARNRYVDILKRQRDGTWRVYLHSWQNDAPPNP